MASVGEDAVRSFGRGATVGELVAYHRFRLFQK